MSLKNDKKIFRYGKNRDKEINNLKMDMELIEKEIDKLREEQYRLYRKKERREKKLERLESYRNSSLQKLYNFDREELITVLDDFIQYKDYFENPPKEAYEIDDWDYSNCKEAREIEQLLYKYEIYDTKYYIKLDSMERRYGEKNAALFSRQKLRLDEILAVLTWLHRGERHCGGFFIEAIKDGTFYNLLKRMEQIRKEL